MTKFERQLQLRDSFIERLAHNFRYIVQFQRTHEEYLRGTQEIYSHPKFKAIPGYMHDYIRGYEKGLQQRLHECLMVGLNVADKQQSLLEWVLINPTTGKLYRTETDDSWINEVADELKGCMQGKHYWRKSMDKGDPKFY